MSTFHAELLPTGLYVLRGYYDGSLTWQDLGPSGQGFNSEIDALEYLRIILGE